MTRRAYLAQLLRVIRWQGAASLKIKIKRQLDDFDLNFSTCEKFASSFYSLTIFSSSLSEMMSAWKAKAPDKGGMMNSSVARS